MNNKRVFFQYVIPSVLSFALSGVYAIVDGFFVGNSIGDIGLSAINIAYPITAVLQATGTDIGMGGAVKYSILKAEGKEKKAREYIAGAIWRMIFLSIVLTGTLSLTSSQILTALGASGELLTLGKQYITVIALGTLLQVFGTGLVPFMRNYGGSFWAMVAMICGFATNIILDYAFMMEKFDVVGVIGGHFDKANYNRFEEHHTADASYEEILKIVELMGLSGKFPIYCGANEAMPDEITPIITEAARFIVEEAMKEDPRPLYIGMQGAITDLACAILIEPKICERMTCIWIGGGDYPEGGGEFNLMQDIAAANVVFASSMPVWQVPRVVYKQFGTSLAELQLKVEPCGAIGKYLFQQMVDFNNRMLLFSTWPHGEIWTLGDEGCICALLEEIERNDGYDLIEAPRIMEDGRYEFGNGYRKIRVYKKMDVRLDLEDLFAKLKINFGS